MACDMPTLTVILNEAAVHVKHHGGWALRSGGGGGGREVDGAGTGRGTRDKRSEREAASRKGAPECETGRAFMEHWARCRFNFSSVRSHKD